MSSRIEGKAEGLQRRIDRLARSDEFLEIVGNILVESTMQRISKTKMGPDGSAWPAWATSTGIARAKKGNAGLGLLWDDGTLLGSITYEIQGKQVVVGSNAGQYAEYLQNGTGNMPARPFIGISKEDLKKIDKALADFVKDNE